AMRANASERLMKRSCTNISERCSSQRHTPRLIRWMRRLHEHRIEGSDMLRVVLAVVMIGGSSITQSEPASAGAGTTINSISPSCAGAGQRVTLNGKGFGGPNIVISVGGALAKVLSASGTQATFAVPEDVLPGL